MSLSKNWCLTWNNYPDNWKSLIQTLTIGRKKEKLSYWIAGKERAPVTGTHHLQMFIQLKTRVRLTTLKRALTKGQVLPAPHLEAAKGGLEANQTYCKKEGNFEEEGEPKEYDPKIAGRKAQREDLKDLRDGILQGKTDLELALDNNTLKASAQFMRFTQNLRIQAREKERKDDERRRLTGVELRDWQNEAVLALDTYVPLPPVQLTWCPSKTGSHFKEFDTFETHEYSFM